MAKFCEHCGTQLNFEDEKCPSCGAPTGITAQVNSTESVKSESQTKAQAGDQQDYRPQYNNNGQGYNGQGYSGGYNQYQRPNQPPQYNRYGQGYNNPYSNPYANPYNNGQGGYPNGYYMPEKQRTISVGLIIFSIINILFGCGGLVMIFGIVALVMTIQAKNAATDEEEASKKKIALILNIVSIALFVVAIILIFVLGMFQTLMYM